MAELKFVGEEDAAVLLRLAIVEPDEGESISHFLGRVRRSKANSLPSRYSLGKVTGLGSAISRWERLYFNSWPLWEDLEQLGRVLQIAPERLREMFPGEGIRSQPTPIRLCGACYGEVPCHRIEWQYQWPDRKTVCDRHGLHLLMKCPNCGEKFSVPSLWDGGKCGNCFFPYTKMAKF